MMARRSPLSPRLSKENKQQCHGVYLVQSGPPRTSSKSTLMTTRDMSFHTYVSSPCKRPCDLPSAIDEQLGQTG